ncbi:hypothetical protein FKM82_013304 [Ascaphus truei]
MGGMEKMEEQEIRNILYRHGCISDHTNQGFPFLTGLLYKKCHCFKLQLHLNKSRNDIITIYATIKPSGGQHILSPFLSHMYCVLCITVLFWRDANVKYYV